MLPGGAGARTIDQSICLRPETGMRRRGNVRNFRWTCSLCQMRWERRPVSTYVRTGELIGDERVTFGMCAGYAFKEAVEKDFQRCEWAMGTCESGEPMTQQGLVRLAMYTATRERREAMMDGEFQTVGEGEDDDLYS